MQSYYSWDDIEEKVRQAAGNLLAFDNVDFAHTLYLSKFYEAIEDIEGVEYVTITEFRRENTESEEHWETGKIQLKENEIPVIPCDAEDSDYAGGVMVKQIISGD